MTAVALLGMAIGHALAVDPGATARAEQDPSILKALRWLSGQIGAATGQTVDRPTVKDAGGLYYLWALERIAVLYDLKTLDDKDWFKWGAEILVCHQRADGSWGDGGFAGEDAIINTALAALFLKRANLTPDLSKRLVVDPNALTAKVNTTPPKPSPPPPKQDVSAVTAVPPPPPKKEEPPPKVTPTPPSPAPVAEAPAPPKKSAALAVAGRRSGLIAAIGLLLILLVRRGKSDEDDDEDEEDERPRKKGKDKPAMKAKKASRSKD